MNESMAKFCMLIDELMKKQMVLSQKVEKSTTSAGTGPVVIRLTLWLSPKAFTDDYIKDCIDVSDE